MAGRFNPDDYVDVAERIQRFHDKYPHGSLTSEVITDDGKRILMKGTASAFVVVDGTSTPVLKQGTGHAEEIRGDGNVNKTSAVENCETSAWGRAIAALAFEVSRGIASKQEMQKVQRAQEAEAKPAPRKKSLSVNQLSKIQERIDTKKVPDDKLKLALASVGADALVDCTDVQAKDLLEMVGA